MTHQEQDKIFKEGQSAFLDNVSYLHSPYDEDSEADKWWSAGWRSMLFNEDNPQ